MAVAPLVAMTVWAWWTSTRCRVCRSVDVAGFDRAGVPYCDRHLYGTTS